MKGFVGSWRRPLTIGFLLSIAIAQAAGAGPRVDVDLDSGWRFFKGDVPGAEAPDFDGSLWPRVSLPHTWNADDGARGGGYYRGPGWYRRAIRIGANLAGKRLILRFGAASLVANVFVNGKPLGEHRGGFSAFCFDATDQLHQGDNLLAVRVDNSKNLDVTPLSGDFTVYGGLYRDVHLLGLDPLEISPLDDGSSGVYLKTDVSTDAADVEVTTKLRNASASGARVAVVATVLDQQGRQAGQSVRMIAVEAGLGVDAVQHIKIGRPHLWDGVNDPYLYRAIVEIRQGRAVLDRVEQPLGLRFFRVDPERGLLLNGKPYDMHGVNIHQGRPSVGWAATARMQDEDYAMVKELGCTGVRMCHYQHAEHEHDLCDRYGLVTWAELALVNQVTDSPAFYDNAKQQLRELIKQNFNHPSILFWSMYNEPWVDRKRGDNEWRLVKELVAEAHDLDPKRLTTGAASAGAREELDYSMDIASFNRYWGWYGGSPNQWTTGLDALRAEAAGRSFGMSEFGAGASAWQHEANPRQPTPNGKWHPEEWQSVVHEAIWPALNKRPWVWCKLLWVMFDFGSAWRNEGDHPGINDKGLVTGDRKTRKDAFYYYKANWSREPFVYITERRFDPHPAGTFDVKVDSNCDSVELWLDGVSQGLMTSPSHVFVWPGVVLSGAGVHLRATGRSSGRDVVDEVRWRIAP